MDYILGLDGGGSKTTVQIADITGKVLVEKKSGSSNYKSVGVKNAARNINTAVFKALYKLGIRKTVFKSACFGVAGNDTEGDLLLYNEIVFNDRLKRYLDHEKTIICNDSKIGLVAGSSGRNRLMIISGTGANCFGIDENGREAKSNGWDYILGDEGSGYTAGLNALKAIVRSYDGRGPSTILAEKVMEFLKLKDVSDLVSWVYKKPFKKERIARLAEIVCRCATLGDEVSIKLLRDEAKEAAASVTAVAARLGLENKEFDLVLVGGVFKCEKFFTERFFKMLRQRFEKINFVALAEKPVEGAIKLALENIRPGNIGT